MNALSYYLHASFTEHDEKDLLLLLISSGLTYFIVNYRA